MADEIISRDGNRRVVLAGITDDANGEIRMLRVDPTTMRLKCVGNAGVTGPTGPTGGTGPTGSGSSSIADQKVWTDVFTVSRTSDTVVTYTAATAGAATIMANTIVGHLARWRDSGDATTKYGFVRNATASDVTVTINLYGTAFAAGDINFRLSIFEKVKEQRWYIPGEQVADASNPVGFMLTTPASQDWRLICYDVVVGTAAAGSGAAMTADIYDDGTGMTTSDTDLTTNSSALNVYPTASQVIVGASILTLRTPTAAGATNKASDLMLTAYLACDDLWDAV